ncbi:TlyA family RNA methyltransferase [Sedimentibacter sp. LTW-03]
MQEYRLDVYLQTKGLTESRAKAKQLIIGGSVYVNDRLQTKPSGRVTDLDEIKITNNFEYVGRGASKLEKAVKHFNIDIKNKTAVDIGASTGGFTDYLVKNQAKMVYAVDVGHGQLHESLKKNALVINIEGTNFRYIDTAVFKEDINIITADVSFISLKLIFPKIYDISNESTDIIVLIKPQFEAGRHSVGKNGIIKDKKTHLDVLNNIQIYCAESGLCLKEATFSPVKGGDGNIEYLGYIRKESGQISVISESNFKGLINTAFDYYKKN